MSNSESKHTNALIHESSPYLLQHAHNPVNWLPWGEEAKTKAKTENKLLLVSIGYSSCHWCHVMEKECFEDEEVAAMMNRYFVSVKVDREERPDVDQLYMEAVQMMRQQGGWPLNCFTTPDGHPIYGGTYYPKDNWLGVLQQLADLWENSPDKVLEYGQKLVDGMQVTGILPPAEQDFPLETIADGLEKWKSRFDKIEGGPDKAPKFPLPANYLFLLRYGKAKNHGDILNHVRLTLDKMALGGIYDQIGGGFTRYSTDKNWKVPHFEKMLYDNAQLLGLYSEAYAALGKNQLYAETVEGIKSWLRREMKSLEGGFYSAIDADSEGVEGLFYTMAPHELPENLKSDYEKFFYTDHNALWEERLIPVRKDLSTNSSAEAGSGERFEKLKTALLEIRNQKVRPLTDDKVLCSWNAMLAKGFVQSYRYLKNPDDLDEALEIFKFIDTKLYDQDSGELYHSFKNGKTGKIGFLEDYAFYIDALIAAYQSCFREDLMAKALELTYTTLDRYYDRKKGVFFFTAANQDDLVSRPLEMSDNVIPASNSVMAHNLFFLGTYYDKDELRDIAKRLLGAVKKGMGDYMEAYANWAGLYAYLHFGAPEVVITGSDALQWSEKLDSEYLPFTFRAAARSKGNGAIFTGRFTEHKTSAFICKNQTCSNPVDNFEAAKTQIELLKTEFEKD